ncbi:MAG TPA: hypothetical protein VJJ22_04350 [Candidatus Paceibacterota bacterium]
MEKEKDYTVPATILISAIFLSSAWVYTARLKVENVSQNENVVAVKQTTVSALEEKVLPSGGVILPVRWGDLGSKLVGVGVIDKIKFKALYEERGLYSKEYETILTGNRKDKLVINKENAGFLLNIFWALGLASKNPILETGEMSDPAYGGAGNFASTGGWTLAVGSPMDHFSKHKFFILTDTQQALIERVSSGIYRPCCANSTHFPDCNHGMAMLGLLELMASQGASEQEMWKAALAVNSYWFPDTYMTIAQYMGAKGVDWEDVDPRVVLGADYSSASGYRNIASQVASQARPAGGGGCGV